MSVEIEIRKAGATDTKAIARLIDQLGYPVSGAEVPARIARLSNNDRASVLVAQRDGEVVGLATVHVLSVLNRARDVAWLTLLVVDESARRSGVGRRLVDAVEQFARESNCERLSVTTHESRKDAHEFYARIGLERTGRRFGKMLAS